MPDHPGARHVNLFAVVLLSGNVPRISAGLQRARQSAMYCQVRSRPSTSSAAVGTGASWRSATSFQLQYRFHLLANIFAKETMNQPARQFR